MYNLCILIVLTFSEKFFNAVKYVKTFEGHYSVPAPSFPKMEGEEQGGEGLDQGPPAHCPHTWG